MVPVGGGIYIKVLNFWGLETYKLSKQQQWFSPPGGVEWKDLIILVLLGRMMQTFFEGRVET